MGQRAIILEIDDVLLNSEKKITDKTRESLFHAQENGIKLILVANKSVDEMLEYVNILNLDDYHGAFISFDDDNNYMLAMIDKTLLYTKSVFNGVNEIDNTRIKLDSILSLILKQMKVDNDEVIVFGADFKDIEMLRCYGVVIAMQNANENLKSIADEITLSNDEDGIAYILDTLI